MKLRWLILVALILSIAIAGYVLADWSRSSKPLDYPRQYVGRESCIDCHQEQATLFHGSHHDLAMDKATETTVLADFDNQELEHDGLVSKMYRDGEKFMVRTDGPDGEMADFEVKYVFGYHPLQQYMVEIDRPASATTDEIGRIQVLRVSWDVEHKKWFYLMPPDVDERLEHTDPLHWTGVTQNWNSSCAYCHSTNVKKNFDPFTGQFRTTFSEIDVSCEACHGPGSLHVELANRRSLFWDRNHQFGLAKLKTETNRAQVETCAQCHSRRIAIADNFQGGCNYDDYFSLQLLTDPIYHLDGQQRDENFVYGSFIQSKMYHNGIKCSDCHDPHSLKLKYDGNQLCTSCHQHPSGKYDSPLHHHHTPGLAGSFCVDCHMPETVYMMCDPRRDHSFRVPRPDLSVQFGTPNSCTGCHLDTTKLTPQADRKPLKQYLDWILVGREGDQDVAQQIKKVDQAMLEAVQKWYPDEQSEPKAIYYDHLTIGQSALEESASTSMQLSRDRSAPAIFRATAFEVLSGVPDEQTVEVALAGLNDQEPKVVAAALTRLDYEIRSRVEWMEYSGLRSKPETELQRIARAVMQLLKHPSRRVRIESARVMLVMPPEIRNQIATPRQLRELEMSKEEYRNSLLVEQDRAHFQLMLANFAELDGNREQAKDHYRTAIKIEPYLSGSRSNLAVLLDQQIQELKSQIQQPEEQERQSPIVQSSQNHNEAVQRIKKLNEEVKRLRKEDHQLLAKDIERAKGIPGTHGLHYQYAMSCYLQEDLAGTEKHLLEACRQDPQNSAYLLGLATYYLHVKENKTARRYIQQLLDLEPNHPAYLRLKEEADAQN